MPRIETRPLPRASALWSQVQTGDFIDGYAVRSDLTPREAADLGLSLPRWARALLALRNRIVRPFGLKTGETAAGTGALFPKTFEDRTELILGTDDRHLDFRICIRQERGQIHMATWVHRHNVIGFIYLALVMPFHVVITRSAMHRIARASPSDGGRIAAD
ncbi:DUF2867 domain-containing protein [Tritonibacter horizontis]|uniref:DUF2867 domain-containing protein n=1 Tax=Tritonibacter horizontis TaxID=1768241 RepID=A0A132BQ18_9RHOB|nr:DUF2867 domain-containing protein [Tritonibacter horizontis]KUP90528.1 hypothetical protein TRIHO_46110 [Tritonibacter horizontis]